MAHWSLDAFFYHIYPLGMCGAPRRNDFSAAPQPRLEKIYGWLDHLQYLGVDALYLGPVFESTGHGYDTADYYHVDRRLGEDQTLASLSAEIHRRGMRLILDGVFNHVGRDFWAFRDVQQNLEGSAYRDWFHNLRFEGRSPYGDPFTYDTWNGFYELVKLNLHNPEVREHLFQAIATWVREYDIDGLRLDAADSLDLEFLRQLSGFCKKLRPDFWLMGEVVHGDYRRWANPGMLDSVTNYEVYKSLYSSHNDRNYFEIAYALNRQFGEGGIYRDIPLYAFADNHDVNRVASSLTNPSHLYPLYCLLFTMPGVPSLYYGSEWGISGEKDGSDDALRPALDYSHASRYSTHPDLAHAIQRLARVRREQPALRRGSYQQLHVSSEQFAFARQREGEYIVTVVNASDQPAAVSLNLTQDGAYLEDLLNPGEGYPAANRRVSMEVVPPNWGRVLILRR